MKQTDLKAVSLPLMWRMIIWLCLAGTLYTAEAQVSVTWDELAEVKFTSQYDEEMGIAIQTAYFSGHVLSLDGKDILLTGFLIPIDPLGTRYVISRFPNANCFFCGNAGPETIAELQLVPQHQKRYATDTHATFKGRLKLNTENLTTFNYVLVDAERVR